ncbi:MAG: class I lanthipeptide [Bacteroidia bacterium]
MKKVKLTGKLSLKKETITKLNKEQMGVLMGGSRTITNCFHCPSYPDCPSYATCSGASYCC